MWFFCVKVGTAFWSDFPGFLLNPTCNNVDGLRCLAKVESGMTNISMALELATKFFSIRWSRFWKIGGVLDYLMQDSMRSLHTGPNPRKSAIAIKLKWRLIPESLLPNLREASSEYNARSDIEGICFKKSNSNRIGELLQINLFEDNGQLSEEN